MKTQVIVAGTNASGESDMVSLVVDVTDKERDNGEHYEKAELLAGEAGYSKPFVCFDCHEQSNIARIVEELTCPVPFSLAEQDALLKDQSPTKRASDF